MSSLRQLSIGFQGGLALSLRVPEEQLDGFYQALGTSGWYALESDDGPVRLELSQVLYVRTEVDDQRVGFG